MVNLYVIAGIAFFYILSLFYVKKKYLNMSPLLYIDKIKRKDSSNVMGVFASQNFEIGDVIGNVATLTSPTRLPIYTKYGKYIQHSKNPNIVLRPLKFSNIIRLYGIVIKKIRKNDEITYDYKDLMAPKPNTYSKLKTNNAIYKHIF